ncbi:hypothetical protein [Halomonas sp. E19]|uniref:hypothetical protein n=1 Tax=Halomonas sp. E19 TaxID=3397247 RepID=UPI004033595A
MQRHLLGCLGFATDSDAAVAAELERLRTPPTLDDWPPLITAERGAATALPSALPGGTPFSCGWNRATCCTTASTTRAGCHRSAWLATTG